MKAVILAAKKKEDLFPFTESKPTGLIPVAGKPIVSHLIDSLQQIGVEDIYIVTNYLEEEYEKEYGEYTNVNTVHQEELEGTGSALASCDFLEGEFIVLNGDVIVSTEDLQRLKEKHESEESIATVMASDESKPEKFGVLSITNDRVNSIEEKPEDAENNLVNTGIYVLEDSIFEKIGETEELTAAVSEMTGSKVRFEIAQNYWYDIGSLRKLWKADRVKREEVVGETKIHESAEVHDSVEIDGKAIVKQNAEVKAGTTIEGRVIIGGNSKIGPGTLLEDCSIARDSQLRNATVENTCVFEESIVDPNVFVENSIIGEDSDIKAGTVIEESFIGPRSFIDMNNSMKGVKTVPDARTDLSEISK